MVRDYVQDLETCTENLANASMPGYKKVGVSHSSFSNELARQVGSQSAAPASSVVVDHQQGALRETGRSLDLAVEGDGYFVLSDGNKECYTRNGSFRLSPDGSIVNSLGMKLQGTSGDLNLPANSSPADLYVDDERHLQLGERVVGQLKLVYGNPGELQRAGNTLFMSDTPLVAEGTGTVLSGYLEQSNSTVVDEMVNMMTTLRNFESCQKILKTADEIKDRTIGKLS